MQLNKCWHSSCFQNLSREYFQKVQYSVIALSVASTHGSNIDSTNILHQNIICKQYRPREREREREYERSVSVPTVTSIIHYYISLFRTNTCQHVQTAKVRHIISHSFSSPPSLFISTITHYAIIEIESECWTCAYAYQSPQGMSAYNIIYVNGWRCVGLYRFHWNRK